MKGITNSLIIAEAYFKQPIFDQKIPICFNPFKFAKNYRLKLLERCWKLDREIEAHRLQLENCWQKERFAIATAIAPRV